MKGIILAGGSGTRLYPITEGISKQLMPIYDKPMIYYPLSTLMECGINDVLIITTNQDLPSFKRALKDGEQFGIHIEYTIQKYPRGIAEALIIGENFLDNDDCMLILGDNIFIGDELKDITRKAILNAKMGIATNYMIPVKDPQRFGVAEINSQGQIIGIEEKPEKPKSNLALVGLYTFPNDACYYAKNLKPSSRNELEITDLSKEFLYDGLLNGCLLSNTKWFDTGTFTSEYEAIKYIYNIENKLKKVIPCIEEIAYENGWITLDGLLDRSILLSKNSYGDYLQKFASEKKLVLQKKDNQ